MKKKLAHLETFIGLLIGLAVAAAFLNSSFESLEVKTVDLRFKARRTTHQRKWASSGIRTEAEAVILVPITDRCIEEIETLDGIKKYPLPRRYHAEMVRFLHACGARIIGFDLIFDLPTEAPGDDDAFVFAVREAGNVVVPIVMDETTMFEDGALTKKIRILHSFGSLADVAAGEGYINIKYDMIQEDGIFRKTFLTSSFGDLTYPAFPLALARCYLEGRPEIKTLDDSVLLGERKIPLYRDGKRDLFLINFLSQPEPFRKISYSDLLKLSRAGETGLKKGKAACGGKAVIIGPHLTGEFDFHLTPFGRVPGMDIHGEVLRSILDQDFLTRPGRWPVAAGVTAIGVALGTFLGKTGFLLAFGVTLIFLAGWLALAVALFNTASIALPLVPVGAVIVSCLVVIRFVKLYIDLWRTNQSLDLRVHELSTLYDISRSISMTLITDKEKRINLVLDKSLASIGAERGSLMLYDKMSDELVVEVVRGEGMGSVQQTRLKLGEGIAGKVLATGAPVISNQGQKDDRFVGTTAYDNALKSILCVPLMVDDQPIGVINLVNKTGGGRFTADDERLAMTIGQQAASVIENARLYRLATIDGLTDLYVHRHFQIRLEEELRRARRYGKHLSIMLTDIDHFKGFNDTYGHQTGDLVLQNVARLLRETVRDIDLPARYGGEEFAVILPETDREGALILAERLRKIIETNEVPTKAYGNLKVTISIGVACFPDIPVEARKDLIEFADMALYHAKENGRNRTTIAEPTMTKKG